MAVWPCLAALRDGRSLVVLSPRMGDPQHVHSAQTPKTGRTGDSMGTRGTGHVRMRSVTGGGGDGPTGPSDRGLLHAVPRPFTRRFLGPSGFVPTERVLQHPTLRDDVVIRGELVDVLREHEHVPVVLVTGSPGFGKTTLVAQWESEDDRPFAWLTADESCNDVRVLVTYLALALQRVSDPDAGVVGALADQSDLSGILLPRLGRMLLDLQTPFVL